MDAYTVPTFLVVLGTLVAAGLAAYWTLIGLRREKKRLLRIEYCEHIRLLCSSIIQSSIPQSKPVQDNVKVIQSSKDGYRPPLKPLQMHTHGYISNDEGMINTTNYADAIRKSPINKQVREHLFSFQKKTGNVIYNDYEKLIDHQKKSKKLHDSLFQSKSKDEETKIRSLIVEQSKVEEPLIIGFAGKFVTLCNNVMVDANPDFGYCMGCIDKFGFWEKRKYKKILDLFLNNTGILN